MVACTATPIVGKYHFPHRNLKNIYNFKFNVEVKMKFKSKGVMSKLLVNL